MIRNMVGIGDNYIEYKNYTIYFEPEEIMEYGHKYLHLNISIYLNGILIENMGNDSALYNAINYIDNMEDLI